MFYEYRRYEVMHGRMEDLKRRFAEETIPLWEQSGIKHTAFFEPRVGQNNVLHYLLAWEDLGAREEVWEAFRVNPDWVRARTKSEENGPLISRIDNEIWVPTEFSPLQ